MTAALISDGGRGGWLVGSYVLVLLAGLLGTLIAAAKEGDRAPRGLLFAHATVAVAGIGLATVAAT